MGHTIASHVMPLVLAMILFVISLNSLDQITRWFDRGTPAISWQGVEVVSEIVHPGGTLTVEYTAVINKQCPSDLRGFLVAPDDTVPVRYPVVAGGYSKPSQEPRKIRVSVTVPKSSDPGLAPLKSGPHVYRTVATRYCPEGVEEDTSIPDAPFMLEVPQ